MRIDFKPVLIGNPSVCVLAREFQVLELLCTGCKNDEIANKLGLGLSTVKTHVGTIMRKLDCRNRVEIVARAHDLNLI
jgi:DNA-binding NarL/FixJ family response regulator